jgi:hypothetical protein
MSTDEILLGLGLVFVLAVSSQVLAHRLGLPAIVVLLPAGFVAGIATDDVHPEALPTWRIGFGRLSGADTLSTWAGRSGLADALAQQKTSAATASASRGLRRRFGIKERERRAAETRAGAALACSRPSDPRREIGKSTPEGRIRITVRSQAVSWRRCSSDQSAICSSAGISALPRSVKA